MLLPSLFSNLDSFTITTGIISLFTALLSFILAIVEGGKNKKLLFGLTANSLKRISIYVTLITGILTLFLNWNHQIESAAAATAKERKADSMQQLRFDSTLREVNKTLLKQDTTLAQQSITLFKQDSTLAATGHILAGQRQAMANQSEMFIQQKIAFDTTSQILHRQLQIQDSIDRSIYLGNLNRQALTENRTDVNTLNFPLSNGMAAVITLRLYIIGLSTILQDSDTGEHRLLKENEYVDTCIWKHFGHMKIDLRKKYWDLFSFTNIGWLDRAFELDFDSATPNNRVVYAPIKSIEAGGMFVVYSDILYNPSQNYFQWNILVPCGNVIENPAGVKNLYQVVRHSTIHIKISYPRLKTISLPISNSESKTVTIDRLEIIQAKQFLYGSTGQFTIPNPPMKSVPPSEKVTFMEKYWHETVFPQEAWRYAGVEIHIQ